jgi:hypothetical protein
VVEPIAAGDFDVIPGIRRLAGELVKLLSPLLETHQGKPARIDATTQARINVPIGAFHNVLRSGAQDLYVFHVFGVRAYSVTALLENAASHLSELAYQSVSESEKHDFNLAGVCLALDVPTASGFHAMRSLEAEARRYHKVVTGMPAEVDWTLEPLINGNSGRQQFGLRDQWKKEGQRDDSPLLLIITLLKSIAQIYRNPIMHPEMVLTQHEAKHVFDTAGLVISAMVEDRTKREQQSVAGLP